MELANARYYLVALDDNGLPPWVAGATHYALMINYLGAILLATTCYRLVPVGDGDDLLLTGSTTTQKMTLDEAREWAAAAAQGRDLESAINVCVLAGISVC